MEEPPDTEPPPIRKRARPKIEIKECSTHYTTKKGLKSLFATNPFLVNENQSKVKNITTASAHFSRFIGFRLLRCLENDLPIEELDHVFLQKISSLLFSKGYKNKSIVELKEWIKSLESIPELEHHPKGGSLLLNDLAATYATSFNKSLVYTFESRTKRYLKLRMEELLGENDIKTYEKKRVIS